MKGAIIGFGTIAIGHAAAYAEVAGLSLEVAVDPHPARRRMAREGFGLRTYASYEEMTAAERTDFVDICAPPALHTQYIRQAIADGLHVMCEKPVLLPDVDGYAAILRAIEGSAGVVYPAHNYKFAPILRRMSAHVAHPDFGHVVRLHFRTLRTGHARGVAEWRPDWRRDEFVSFGGILRDHGPHSVYLATSLSGATPVAVSCLAGNLRRDSFTATEDSAWVRVRCNDSVELLLDLSWSAAQRDSYYSVIGTGGSVTVENDDIRLCLRGRLSTETLKSDFDDPSHINWFREMFRDFQDVVEHRHRQPTLIAEALMTSMVIDAAYESASRAGSWVHLRHSLYDELVRRGWEANRRGPLVANAKRSGFGGDVPDRRVPPRPSREDHWIRRGRAADARAATRPDVMEDGVEGTFYPRYVDRAAGAYVWDTDGRRYVDYLLGYGPVILGHADERVERAVVREMQGGHCFAPLWSPRQVELCELLTQVIPGGELAYLLKTGSDANSAAVRLARIFTGRDMVVRWGYNGWHDWASDIPVGIPSGVRDYSVTFDHADPESLRRVFEASTDRVACVLTMPFENEVTSSAHLHQLREITHEYGALFIFDEMRSGFRMSLGGAQEYFGIQADLVTLSKAMANGHPISAVVGRADVMSGFAQTRISSTFYAGPVEMAAALTTIGILGDTDALERVWALGRRLLDGLRKIVFDFDLPAEPLGYPPMPFLRFRDSEVGARWKKGFFEETTTRGVLFHPDHQWFLSASHLPADIDLTLDACHSACAAIAAKRAS